MFDRFKWVNLTVNLLMGKLGQAKVIYLGHVEVIFIYLGHVVATVIYLGHVVVMVMHLQWIPR